MTYNDIYRMLAIMAALLIPTFLLLKKDQRRQRGRALMDGRNQPKAKIISVVTAGTCTGAWFSDPLSLS